MKNLKSNQRDPYLFFISRQRGKYKPDGKLSRLQYGLSRPKRRIIERMVIINYCVQQFFLICLLIITLNNYIYNTTKKNTLTIDINRVKQN